MIDDLSDVSSLEQMVVYIQYIDPDIGTIQADFLFIANLLEKSDSVFWCILLIRIVKFPENKSDGITPLEWCLTEMKNKYTNTITRPN